MIKMIKRILFFVTLLVFYFIIREFLELYIACRLIHPWMGYGFLVLVGSILVYFVGIPVSKVFWMPKRMAPTQNPNDIESVREKRLHLFQKNQYLIDTGFDIDKTGDPQIAYEQAIKVLGQASERIRKKYVTQLFYTTAIAQNGFIDAILIFSYSVNMVKELFRLYQGRVSNKALLRIARMVYYSIAIGGSEGIEYAVDELISKLSAGTIKSMPFASRILGSIADGFINAALLTRISLITERYCTILFIETERALYPSYTTVLETTRLITSDLLERIYAELNKLTKDKAGRIIMDAINPVSYVLNKAFRKEANDDLYQDIESNDDNAGIKIPNSLNILTNRFGKIFKRKNK